MQQRYEPAADRGAERAENRLLDALELQARGLIEMGCGVQVERRLGRLLTPATAAPNAGGLSEQAATPEVAPGEIAADGLDLATLLQALVAAERRAVGWREKQTIARGRAWLAAEMKAAVGRREAPGTGTAGFPAQCAAVVAGGVAAAPSQERAKAHT